MRLENKVAIVTGGSTGIGYAVCEGYAKEGAKVAVCGLTMDSAKEAVKKIQFIYPNADLLAVKVDVTSSKEVKKMVDDVIKKWGKIDILVNNAGIVQVKSILEMTDEDYNVVMDVNATGTFRCIREAGKYMTENGGSIINTSSMVGLYGGAYQTAYTASKYAINGITETCAKELGRFNIRVNAVAPGMIETDMVKDSVNDETKSKLIAMAPLKRIGKPEDLTGIYIHLASDESLFTTGTIVSVDGGLIM